MSEEVRDTKPVKLGEVAIEISKILVLILEVCQKCIKNVSFVFVHNWPVFKNNEQRKPVNLTEATFFLCNMT